jgi:nucleotide-binding universal stress UspA family protein/anti-anti-sigma regulatory factor
MIIEARRDVVSLSGSLEKNLWPAIEATANLALRVHPNGIVIDASQISHCTDDGARTFLDAMAYIDRHRARIVVCELPADVLETIKHVPGVRSQLPIADTCEQARASLDLATDARLQVRARRMGADGGPVQPRQVMVPLTQGCMEVPATVGLALQVGSLEAPGARDGELSSKRVAPFLHFLYVLEIPRAMPINAPMTEEEGSARTLLDEVIKTAGDAGVESQSTVARARDVGDEIIARADELGVEIIVISLPVPTSPNRERLHAIVETLLQRAHCEVIVKNWQI